MDLGQGHERIEAEHPRRPGPCAISVLLSRPLSRLVLRYALEGNVAENDSTVIATAESIMLGYELEGNVAENVSTVAVPWTLAALFRLRFW